VHDWSEVQCRQSRRKYVNKTECRVVSRHMTAALCAILPLADRV
jgi:hypothetical protein